MPTGEAGFVSLADVLRSRPHASQRSAPQAPALKPPALEPAALEAPAPEAPAPESPTLEPPTCDPEPIGAAGPASPESPARSVGGGGVCCEQGAAMRDARLFRAALADALEALLVDLSRELAVDVLGRELCLAPADIEAIARRLIAQRCAEEPLRLRVAPAEAHGAFGLPVLADPGLQLGDAMLECRSGDIDARLSVRLAHVLGAVGG